MEGPFALEREHIKIEGPMARKKGSDQRVEFADGVKREIAFEAHLFCANPTCCRFTSYGTTTGKARAIAEAAHIVAASSQGPRSEVSMTETELKSAENGIWLCKNCHGLIDDDPSAYPIQMLRDWKKAHQTFVSKLVGKDFDIVHFELYARSRNVAQRHSFLGYIEGRRVFFDALDVEYPDQVATSLVEIRARIAESSGHLSKDDFAWKRMQRMRNSIQKFLTANPHLATLRCDGGDPVFGRFCRDLASLREEIIPLVIEIAEDLEYQLGNELVDAYRHLQASRPISQVP